METTKRAVFKFGKIDYTGSGKRYPAELEVTLRNRDGIKELSVVGNVWNTTHTDIVMGGQCLDEMNQYRVLRNNKVFKCIYKLWKQYHLNTMHAGTEEQEAFLNQYKEQNETEYIGYEKSVELLKSKGIYEVEYHGIKDGKQFDGTYKYGSSWLTQIIPESVVSEIDHLILARNMGYINDKGIEAI